MVQAPARSVTETGALTPTAPAVYGHPPGAPVLSYEPALDGVRALAVLAVMAYHGGVGWLSGGFLGVDTFFVLSGYLITTLLVLEWQARGTIALGAFWARRARRLLPALLLMLAVVVVAVAFVFPHGTFPTLRGDALATMFYFANWHQIAGGANYFAATGNTSPLVPTWSLAIEEQFYLLWPLVVLGLLHFTRRLSVLFWVCVAGAVASAAEMALLYKPTGNLTRLYYGTDTHAQCLLVGAALGVGLLLLAQRRRARAAEAEAGGWDRLAARSEPAWAVSGRGRVALALVGVAGAVGAGVLWATTGGTSAFVYRGGFLLAALATAAVLASLACCRGTPVALVLSLRPLRYLGRISYGLYLWHFPLYAYLDHARTGLSGWSLLLARFALTVAFATCSYFLVEKPIREGTLARSWQGLVLAPFTMGACALLIVLGTLPVTGEAALAAGTLPAGAPAGGPSHLPPVRLLLVGDSMAQTLGNGWAGPVAAHWGVVLDNKGAPNCSLAGGEFRLKNYAPQNSAPPCSPGTAGGGWAPAWRADVAAFRPDVSVVLVRLDVADHWFEGHWTHLGDPDYDAYLSGQVRTAIQTLAARGGKVVLLTSPYFDTGEQPDGTPWPEDDPARVDELNAVLTSAATLYPGQAYVINLNRLVDPSGAYQADVDGVDVRFSDGIHWTFQGDFWLAPQLLRALRRIALSQAVQGTDATDLLGRAPAG